MLPNLIVPFITTAVLVSIGISLALSAISYGLQILFAPGQPDAKGPRLDDLGGPAVNPGKPIPFAVGRNIANAQIIWSTGLKETSHTEKVSGGKGGGSSQKVTTYTYSTSLALAFNDGEICGVERIIAGGSKVVWASFLEQDPVQAEIDAQVQARYDEVYDEKYQQQIDKGKTEAEADLIAAAKATKKSEKLEKKIEKGKVDITPRYTQIEFFYGTEDQEPSSIIEGVEGVGNVSAFRGTAYIVIEDLQLADFGNFTPPFQIDYATSGESITDQFTTTDGPDDAPYLGYARTVLIDWPRRKLFIRDGTYEWTTPPTSNAPEFLMEYSLDTLAFVQTHDTRTISGHPLGMSFEAVDENNGYLVGGHFDDDFLPDNQFSYVYDPVTKTMITNRQEAPGDNPYNIWLAPSVVVWDSGNSAAVVFSSDEGDEPAAHSFPALNFIEEFANPEPGVNAADGFAKWFAQYFGKGSDGEAWGFWMSPDECRIMRYAVNSSGGVTESLVDTIASTEISGGDFQRRNARHVPYYDRIDNALVFTLRMSDGYFVTKWIEGSGLQWVSEISAPEEDLGTTRLNHRIEGGYLMLENLTPYVIRIDLSDGGVSEITVPNTFESNNNAWDDRDDCQYLIDFEAEDGTPYDFQVIRRRCFSTGCISDPVSLTDVITDYMTRAGYDASEFEIDSAIDSKTIWGFNDNTGRSSREVLTDLVRIKPLVVNEIEGKIRFRLADQAVVATIPKEDVRAYDGQSSPPEWIAEVQTLEDLALPKSLRINYQDIDRALNPNSATIAREITQSRSIVEWSVQAVDAAEDMRESAFMAMSRLMTEKRTFKISVPLKYSVIEPGDAVVIPISDTRTATARVEQSTLGANNIVEMELSLYIDTDLGIAHTDQFDPIDTGDFDVTLDVTAHLLDVPYLTDSAELNASDEEDHGLYVVVGGESSPFRGANLYVNTTDLTTTETFSGGIEQATGDPEWTLIAQFSAPSQAGTITQLPSPDATALVKDTVSEFIVAFDTVGASFESLSDNAVLTSRDNVFAVGDEIIQAQTVEVIDSDPEATIYTFTDLYRGLQGTEWAIGTQSVGDRVVYLDTSTIQRIDLENPDLAGLDIDFRVVGAGDDITSVSTTTLPFTDAGRKPYAPTITDVVRDADDNLTFTLWPRNRYGATWNPADPAFESDPQSFEVDIYNGASVVRTLALSDAYEFTYTAVQQTTDFGSAQAEIVVKPYQLNSDGRRGFTNQETI